MLESRFVPSLYLFVFCFQALLFKKKLFIFNWRIIALQYCVGFYQTSQAVFLNTISQEHWDFQLTLVCHIFSVQLLATFHWTWITAALHAHLTKIWVIYQLSIDTGGAGKDCIPRNFSINGTFNNSYTAVSLNQKWFWPSRGHWWYLETIFFIVPTGEWGATGISWMETRGAAKYTSYNAQGNVPQQRIVWPKCQ